MHGGEHGCGVASVVARSRIALLVAALMLLVNYHKPKSVEWQEACRSCTKRYYWLFAAEHTLIELNAFVIRKFAVIYQYFFTEHFLQPACKLGSQSYFRNEEQDLFSLPQHIVDQMYVYLGLARRCDAVKQCDSFIGEAAHDGVVGFLLR